MKEISIAAKVRSEAGKGSSRRTRRNGFIPGIVYGPETKPVSVIVDEKEFRSSMKGVGGTSIIDLNVDGKHRKVVLRDVQRDPVTSKVIHVDFHAISMNRPINVSIPIRYEGTPVGVKTDGGIMQVTMRDLDISCLPANIPEDLRVDVSELHIGDSIHVKDISIPEARILAEARRTMVVIAAPTVHKEEVTAEEVEEVEGEEVVAEEGAEAPEGADHDTSGKHEDKKE